MGEPSGANALALTFGGRFRRQEVIDEDDAEVEIDHDDEDEEEKIEAARQPELVYETSSTAGETPPPAGGASLSSAADADEVRLEQQQQVEDLQRQVSDLQAKVVDLERLQRQVLDLQDELEAARSAATAVAHGTYSHL